MLDHIAAFFQRHGTWAWPLLIIVLAFAQYANTLGHDYAWDDQIVITTNPRTQQGWAGIPTHFEQKTRQVLADFTGYRPITMGTFSAEYALWGLNPFWGHLNNILLYGLTCCLLFWTLSRLAPDWSPQKRFCVVLLFLVHPLHVEAVANIKSRDEILALLFALLALNTYMRHLRGAHWAYLLLAGAAATLATLSKENAILILPVLALSGFLLVENPLLARLLAGAKALVPALVLIAVFLALTGALPGTPSPIKPVGYWEDLSMGNSLAVSMPGYDALGNSLRLFQRYVGDFLFPIQQGYHSGYNQLPPVHGFALHLYVLGALLLLFGGGLLAARPQTRMVGFGLLFYSMTIVIYLHMFRLVLSDTRADRFMFTPSVGLSIFLIAALDHARMGLWPQAGGARPYVLPLLSLVFVLPMAVGTWLRNPAWHDTLTLLETDMPKLENCAKAHYYLAEELSKVMDSLPDPAATKARVIHHYERAIAITPLAYYAFDGLGNFYNRQGQFLEARAVFERMRTAYPKEADPWFYRGRADFELAHYNDAVAALEQSRSLRPDAPDTWELQALALTRDGQADAAIDLLNVGIPRFPNYLELHPVLSQAYLAAGDTAASYKPLEYLIHTDSQNPLWWKRIIGHSQVLGDAKRASFYYQKALELGLSLQ
jgi:protein O-mannosyl-transferase